MRALLMRAFFVVFGPTRRLQPAMPRASGRALGLGIVIGYWDEAEVAAERATLTRFHGA